jgi:LysR family transcriptional regulator, benzoate and cis,cis-muconate-responsive activator of ben and cat genes
MELRHLRYFLAVAEHQGFRKAAQALRVSHPSLCEQIIDLESEIGTRLFERTNHHVSLIAAGDTFVAGARRTLKSAHQAVEAAQQASREYRGELRIANVGLICPSILARLISMFHERFPKAEISILQQNNFTWIEAVQKRAEIGIGYLPTELTNLTVGALSRLIVATAPVGVAVAVTSEDDHRRGTKLQDFAREPFLILDPNRTGKPPACQRLAQSQSRLLAQKEVFHPSTVTRFLPSASS